MIIGARNHYYVRKGGLVEDFEDAFIRAVNQAVERFEVNASGGTEAQDAVNDIEMGSLDGSANDYGNAFHEMLRNNGLRVERVEGDSYCLFHAVAVGLGRRGEGLLVFEELMEVMENSRDEIAEYTEGPVDEYLMRLRQDGYGDELEIKYMKDIYGVDIKIWTEDSKEGAIESAGYSINEGVINISYRDGIHYDAVVPVTVVVSNSIEKGARNQEGAPSRITPTNVNSSAEVGDTRNLGKLKVIFWNSNGWEQERCDKIAEAALE
jgi:hypothetical protein